LFLGVAMRKISENALQQRLIEGCALEGMTDGIQFHAPFPLEKIQDIEEGEVNWECIYIDNVWPSYYSAMRSILEKLSMEFNLK